MDKKYRDMAIKGYTKAIAFKQSIITTITEDKKAQGVIEYGLLLALIALALVGIMGDMRDAIAAKFQEAISMIKGASYKKQG